MDTNDIIIEIDAQVSRLLQAKALLAGSEITIKRRPGRPSISNLSDNAARFIPAKSANEPIAKRTISAEARIRMAAAQKARWAKAKQVAHTAAAAPAVKSALPNSAVPKTARVKKAVSAKR